MNGYPKNSFLKLALLIIMLLGSQLAYAQSRMISGRVLDETEQGLPQVTVLIKNTTNGTFTDPEGRFQIAVPDTSRFLLFRFLGYWQYEYEIVDGKEVEIILQPRPNGGPHQRWSVGPRYDPLNSLYGLTIGNAFDEQLFIHYADLGLDYLYKIDMQSNFRKDYAFKGQVAVLQPLNRISHYIRPFFSRATLEFTFSDLNSINFSDKKFQFSAERWLFYSTVQAGLAVRDFNGIKGLGGEFGLKRYLLGFHLGASLGIFKQYNTFAAFVYRPIFNRGYLRLEYEKISQFEFLRIGINYTFNKAIYMFRDHGYHRFK